MLKDCIPNQKRIIDAIIEFGDGVQPEIIELIKNGLPLPEETEILSKWSGEWEKISEEALSAANRRGFYSSDPCAWHYSWRDLWSRMRIPTAIAA